MGNEKIEEIEIERISFDSAQPRQNINQMKLDELSKDIAVRGLLYPILVTPYAKVGEKLILGLDALKRSDFKWYLLDGERRLRAVQLLKWVKIDAIIKYDLDVEQMYAIQFASNTKRIQIAVEEMAKAIKRYGAEYLAKNPKGDVLAKLVELTGMSYSYFDMADAINRADEELRDKINSGQLGGYTAAEIEGATKDASLRKGLTEFYVESAKPISPLQVRTIKHDLRKIVKEGRHTNAEKVRLAKSLMEKSLDPYREEKEKKSNFVKYQYELETFVEQVRTWNLDDLTIGQLEILSSLAIEINDCIREEKRRMNKIRRRFHKSDSGKKN